MSRYMCYIISETTSIKSSFRGVYPYKEEPGGLGGESDSPPWLHLTVTCGAFETHNCRLDLTPDQSDQNLWGCGLGISIFLLKYSPGASHRIQGQEALD